MYCVYITTYNGYKLPKYYIGSTSTKKIESEKYYGSVSSSILQISKKRNKIYCIPKGINSTWYLIKI